MGGDLALLSQEISVKTIGLIINPIAGLGGSVGLKGTDGLAEEAFRLGAKQKAGLRARLALEQLLPAKDELKILCASGAMGETIARELGFSVQTVYHASSCTTSHDTVAVAKRMGKVDLLLFAGGDGTARDIVSAGVTLPVIGIPAGVKIHSPVFATHPKAAGRLALRYLNSGGRLQEAEVVDIDEDAYRAGHVSTSLYGYLQVPDDRDFMQHGKATSPASEHSQQHAIASEMIRRMEPDDYYLVGPGTTTRTLMEVLGLPDTLLGVDLICGGQLVQSDLCERDILRRIDEKETHLILTPTGGQGCLLGRGNQQISAEVVKRIGRGGIYILATREKLFHLEGRPLLVDTGDAEADNMLSGYMRAIVGYREEQVIRIAGSED